jgi:hypothetical protein
VLVLWCFANNNNNNNSNHDTTTNNNATSIYPQHCQRSTIPINDINTNQQQVPKSVLPGYQERIPSVLLMMQRYLVAHQGRDQVHVVGGVVGCWLSTYM